MDMDVIVGMLFTLILIAMVGGFILMIPIVRRLGNVMENRLNGGHSAGDANARIRQLEAAINALRADLDGVSERQKFTESLLAERHVPALEAEITKR